jgi:hypothetical protein
VLSASLRRTGIAAGVVALTLTAAVQPALAANGVVGERMTVCAQTLDLRTAPLGPWQGTLYKGQTFLVKSLDGDWVYGFAYGDINRDGWVQNGWFC